MSAGPRTGVTGVAHPPDQVVVHTSISSHPLDVAAHQAAAQSPRAGAVATFVGQVRNHDPAVDGEVRRLEYTAHPDAPAVLRRIAEDCLRGVGADPADEVLGLAVSHRIGLLDVGEVAVVAVVASAHRAVAFEVCAQVIERVKAELPVWKRQILADGSHTWVGLA